MNVQYLSWTLTVAGAMGQKVSAIVCAATVNGINNNRINTI